MLMEQGRCRSCQPKFTAPCGTRAGSAECVNDKLIEWKSPTGRKNSPDEIAEFEARHGVVLPVLLKAAHTVGWDAVAWREGQECVATRPGVDVESTNFHGLVPLMNSENLAAFQSEYASRYAKQAADVIPFGSNGDLYVCLKYADPTHGPEVWTMYMDEESPEDAFYKVADNFSGFLDALVSEDQLEAI